MNVCCCDRKRSCFTGSTQQCIRTKSLRDCSCSMDSVPMQNVFITWKPSHHTDDDNCFVMIGVDPSLGLTDNKLLAEAEISNTKDRIEDPGRLRPTLFDEASGMSLPSLYNHPSNLTHHSCIQFMACRADATAPAPPTSATTRAQLGGHEPGETLRTIKRDWN